MFAAEKVREILKDGRGRTLQELVKESDLSPRSARKVILEFKRKDLLIEKANLKDMRKSVYSLKSHQIVNPCYFLRVLDGKPAHCNVLHPDSDVCRRKTPNKFVVGQECLMTESEKK